MGSTIEVWPSAIDCLRTRGLRAVPNTTGTATDLTGFGPVKSLYRLRMHLRQEETVVVLVEVLVVVLVEVLVVVLVVLVEEV